MPEIIHCNPGGSAEMTPGSAGEFELAALRAALVEGEESGPSQDFDMEEFIARKRHGSSEPE